MTLTLWSNKGLKIYAPARFKRYSEKIQNEWMDAHSTLVNEFIAEETARDLNDILHGKTEFIRSQNKQGILGIIAVEEQLEQAVSIDGAHYENGELQISGTLNSHGIDSIRISAKKSWRRLERF